jgi:glycosyltransferase involved in cell wall biosynthesis
MKNILIALATAWGPRFGGINAFNSELVKSLGIQPDRDFEVFCIVPQTTENEIKTAENSYHVRIIGLGYTVAAFGDSVVEDIQNKLVEYDFGRINWLGHDDKTGPLALQLRDTLGGRAALIHHMAHGAYQGYKKGDSRSADDKEEEQRRMFFKADICLAVGPLLTKKLEDLLSTEKNPPPVTMLVPGLDDPAEHGVHCPETPPNYFSGFAAGRLSPEDDRIKQGRLALHGFAEAAKRARQAGIPRMLIQSPCMNLMGIDPEHEACIRHDLEEWAESQLEVKLLPFSEDRGQYYRKLAGSSFAMMLSWHEGFGLTGWEAIAASVPLILGKNSGLYELLHDEFQNQGQDICIHALNIAGHMPQTTKEENHRPEDVEAVVSAINKLADNPAGAKRAAHRLRDMIDREGWNWKRTAQTLITAVQLPMRSTPDELLPFLDSPQSTNLLPDWLSPPVKTPDRPEWGLSPSLLLQATAAVVPYYPTRQPVLDNLLSWAELIDHPVKLCTYVGPAGTGKTRLALEAGRILHEKGWHIHWLAGNKPENWLECWRNLLKAHIPYLVVLDYAETRADEISALLQESFVQLQSVPSLHLRIILLARATGEWWTNLTGDEHARMLLNGPATTPPMTIPPIADDITTREAVYRASVQAFSEAMGRTVPDTYYVPSLELTLYERPLYIQLTALAALDGQRPASARSLLDELINREWRYWKHTVGDLLPISYTDWSDALALFALCGGCPSIDEASHLLRSMELPAKLADSLANCYPGRPGIASLQPDMPAEWLLRCRLGETRGQAIAKLALKYAAVSSLVILGRFCANYVGSNALPLKVEEAIVGALVDVWPTQGQRAVDVAHASQPGLGKLLAQAWKRLTLTMQQTLAQDLRRPNYSICLLDLQVEVSRTLCNRSNQSDSDRAGSLNNLAKFLSEQGGSQSRTEALACAREAVTIYRQLAENQPAAYLPNLASSLNNFASHLSAQGDAPSRTEALECAREAVKIYRQLAETQPAAYLPDLAMSLNTLANRLSEKGDALSRSEALACAREAVTIYRQLAETQPAAYLPDLAMSLNNLANRLSEKGDAPSRSEALACAREAVKIRRQLAETQPAAYLPDLAMSLNNLASFLSEQGDAPSRTEALACAREAVKIRRQLAETQSAAYLPYLAGSLNNLANRLSEQGDAPSCSEALECARESVKIRRQLVETQPAAYLPDLAMSLNNLANRLSERGDAPSRTEALACAREAVKIYRQLVETQPAAYLSDLAMSLNNLANRLSRGDARSRTEALACAREAVKIYRQLAETQPAACLSNLATSLNNLANRLSEQGNTPSRTEALECAREAVNIYALAWKAMPNAYDRNLKIASRCFIRCAEALTLDGTSELETLMMEIESRG